MKAKGEDEPAAGTQNAGHFLDGLERVGDTAEKQGGCYGVEGLWMEGQVLGVGLDDADVVLAQGLMEDDAWPAAVFPRRSGMLWPATRICHARRAISLEMSRQTNSDCGSTGAAS